ncbi:hypothetical protein BGZ82_001192 [Podila clonocystis]|nr:hypothetical protein BGZ82_001192 [Podila clonocystis]
MPLMAWAIAEFSKGVLLASANVETASRTRVDAGVVENANFFSKGEDSEEFEEHLFAAATDDEDEKRALAEDTKTNAYWIFGVLYTGTPMLVPLTGSSRVQLLAKPSSSLRDTRIEPEE